MNKACTALPEKNWWVTLCMTFDTWTQKCCQTGNNLLHQLCADAWCRIGDLASVMTDRKEFILSAHLEDNDFICCERLQILRGEKKAKTSWKLAWKIEWSRVIIINKVFINFFPSWCKLVTSNTSQLLSSTQSSGHHTLWYIFKSVCMCVYIYIYIYIVSHPHTGINMITCLQCVCVYIYIYIYIYIYTHSTRSNNFINLCIYIHPSLYSVIKIHLCDSFFFLSYRWKLIILNEIFYFRIIPTLLLLFCFSIHFLMRAGKREGEIFSFLSPFMSSKQSWPKPIRNSTTDFQTKSLKLKLIIFEILIQVDHKKKTQRKSKWVKIIKNYD